MEQKLEATINAIEVKEVTRKSDNARVIFYEVETSDGTYTTSRREVAEEAWNHKGEPMLLTVETVESKSINQHTGRPFVNHYLQKVEFPGNGRSLRSQFPTPDGPRGGEERVSAVEGLPEPPEAGAAGHARDLSIYRQVAVKAAPHISSTADEFKANVDAIYFYLQHSQWPGEVPDSPGPSYQGDEDIPF